MNIFELYATIGLKADEFFKGLDEAIKKAEAFGEGIERVVSRCEEFGRAFDNAAENVGAVMEAVGEVAEGTDSAAAALEEFGKAFEEVVDVADYTFSNITEKVLKFALLIEEVLVEKVEIFGEKFEQIREGVIGVFEELSRGAQEIIRRMMTDVDLFLRLAGFNSGRNFFRALGDGLIAEEGRLMAEALRVADAIGDIFRQRQINAGAFSGGFGGFMAAAPMANGAMDIREDYLGSTVVQNFYGVREERTAFEAYRAAQKAIAMGVR
ncbi:MAG: hypothetical protein FWE24_09095 [Defluviitaleaceae bacterium]|nr:hypothetical protein [Defluviitaleaceae bacterium]